MNTKMLLISAIALLFMATGCTSEDETNGNGPSAKDITKKLNFEVPVFVKVKDVKIKISVNEGSKIEPLFKSRFSGKIEFMEPLYKQSGSLMGKAILEKAIEKGEEIKLYGLANSRLVMGEWDVTIRKLDISNIKAKPLTNWSAGGYVVSGSDEEEELKEKEVVFKKEKKAAREVERLERLEDLKAEKEAEAIRKKYERAEREAQRLEAIKVEKAAYQANKKNEEAKRKREAEDMALRKKLEADKIKREKTKRDAEKKVAKKKEQMIRTATRLVSGEWSGEFICTVFGGATKMKMDLSPLANKVKGKISFVSVNGKLYGTLAIAGDIDETGKITVAPQGWLGKHTVSSYKQFGLSGQLNASGSELTGNIVANKSLGCSVFQVIKVK